MKKLNTINIIIMPSGNAAKIERLCNWFKLHLINKRERGKITKTIDQNALKDFLGISLFTTLFWQYIEIISVIASKVLE